MIGRLHGILVGKKPPDLLVDVNGVGYEVAAPMSTFYQLPEVGEKVTLQTHLVVREDAHLLYGFATAAEREMFRALLKVNGVGPKLALTILSGISIDEFVLCVHNNDAARLVRLPGVGKKTAERLIIEMRDRLAHWETGPRLDGTTLSSALPSLADHAVKDAIEALVSLGYSPPEASKMISKVDASGRRSEEIIRAALQALTK